MSDPRRRKASFRAKAVALGALLLCVSVWVATVYSRHGRLRFDCGILPSANDPFLDGSGAVLQRTSWHLGDGTRTSGDTFGVKIRSCFLSLQITRVNPRRSAKEAGEEE